jgi:hypothetical protein
MHLNKIVVVQGAPIGARSLDYGQMQLLIHKATVRIAKIAQESLSSQFKKMKVVAMIHGHAKIHLV